MDRLAPLLLVSALLFVPGGARAGSALEHIRKAGVVTCAVESGTAGMAGFEADLCRAIGAALFGAPDRARLVQIEDVQRFLRSTDADVALGGLTWSFTRETSLPIRFGPVVFYDGQAFLVPKSLKLKSATGLSGRPVCVSSAERGPDALSDWFREKQLTLKAVLFDSNAKAWDAFRRGECSALSADASALASMLAKTGSDYSILPDRISKEPLAPLLRRGDDAFFDIVRWSILALIEAEELGLSSTTVESTLPAGSEASRFLALKPPAGCALDPHWTSRILRAVGSYREIYERNLGQALPRGLNRLWTEGGLLYAPPFR